MLTVSEDDETVLGALKAGAQGYALNDVSGPELLHVLRRISAGEIYITPTLATAILTASQSARSASDALATLNERELSILIHLARGRSNRPIAEAVHLSEKTVKHYMANILQKRQARHQVETALIAKKILPPNTRP